MSRFASACAISLAVGFTTLHASAQEGPAPAPASAAAAAAPAEGAPSPSSSAPAVQAPPAAVAQPVAAPSVAAPSVVAPPSSPAVDVPIPARADGRALGVCGTEPAAAIAKKVKPSIVPVAGNGWWAKGFVFGAPDLVVAPLVVAEPGRGVVVTVEGRDVPATIAAIDDASGMALLRVPGLHGTPLEPSPVTVTLGSAVVGFSEPWDGSSDTADVVTQGTISGVEGESYRATPRVVFGSDLGAPLVDCGGRVLGVATTWGDEVHAVRPAHAMVLRAQAGAPPYEGRWSIEHPSLHVLFEMDQTGRPWGGLDLGLALVGYDKWELGLSGRFVGSGDDDSTPGSAWTTKEWAFRGGADLRGGARLMLTDGAMPLYLVPHLGIGFDVTAIGGDRSRSGVESDDCSPEEPCDVVTRKETLSTATSVRVTPAIGLAFRVGFIDLDYTFRVDLDEPEGSSHTVGLGVQF